MTTEKRFVKAYCKKKEFNNGGSIIKISISKDDFNKIQANEKGFVNLVLATKKSEDDYGNTHYLYVDDFVPKKRENKDFPF